ncbi:growth/differentiation factor 2 [Nematolebias whitei]|uniref:growth/differentiation factor 2 n=1 Tax=Nematolebias whitei TaxID=451745 RepID=UPI00189C36C4|nr:growth/differentiation factor 2 [Nematolebias whitei]
MNTSRTFLFHLVVCFGSCNCKPLSNDVQIIEDLEKSYKLSEDLLAEEDTKSRVENLVGSLKEGFLRQLNLSTVPQERSRISPPQIMVDLYNKYVSDSSTLPQYDVIRSFMVQDILTIINGTKSQHRLQFNGSIPNHEKITTAELQLLFLQDARSEVTSESFKVPVKVYKVDGNNFTSPTQSLYSKEIVVSQSTWVTFDVTTSVQSWLKLGHGVTVFDVVMDMKDCSASDRGEEKVSCFNMSLSIGDNTSAILIVYSNDFSSKRREAKKELKEMMLHEEETFLQMGEDLNRGNQPPNEMPDTRYLRRMKRKAELEYCHRTSLKVNFKDIGWDSWIVAPPEYDAFECRGVCYHPLTDESTPSKHALIQALMNLRDPKKANMACCVPIKLDPITVMYQENGRLTIRYLYEEMKVAECGCR